ncbi:hypothetical protein DB42_EA00300 [Neochlamydia sp. EPS4]|nr:hypothetical protein DB42_EA00300 [Neochlamydia sp. EPS4]
MKKTHKVASSLLSYFNENLSSLQNEKIEKDKNWLVFRFFLRTKKRIRLTTR